jgi:hypothetical protein
MGAVKPDTIHRRFGYDAGGNIDGGVADVWGPSDGRPVLGLKSRSSRALLMSEASQKVVVHDVARETPDESRISTRCSRSHFIPNARFAAGAVIRGK